MNGDSFLLVTGTGKKDDILVWFVDTFLETFGTVAFGIADKVFQESFAGYTAAVNLPVFKRADAPLRNKVGEERMGRTKVLKLS